MSEEKFITRAELKEVLAELADRIVRHFEPRFEKNDHHLAELSKQVVELSKQVAELSKQVAELSNRQSRVETQLNELRNQIILLQSRLDRVEAGVDKIALGIFKLQSEDELAHGQLAHHAMELSKLKQRLEVVEREISNFKSQHQAAVGT